MRNFNIGNETVVFSSSDEALEVEEVSLDMKRRTRGIDDSENVSTELEQILKALSDDEMKEDSFYGFNIKKTNEKNFRDEGSNETMSIDVNLNDNEDVVILLEQDGSYEWIFPDNISTNSNIQRNLDFRTRSSKTAHFNIATARGKVKRTRGLGSIISDFIEDKIIGYVIKFVARKAVSLLTRKLERNVNVGPIIISSATDINEWNRVENYLSITFPQNRSAKILLLIHGTFSSTEGSYGALTEYEFGQEFLEQALEYYDAVIGYDHYTLADTPKQNAEEIFEKLNELQNKTDNSIEIDSISFSRGGLVYRYLTEKILPESTTNLLFKKVIFVGCTNAGTQLANSENWKTLVDSYTTMIAGASRLLALSPTTKIASTILEKGIKIIGDLIKYIAQDAVVDNSVPGLASMSPEGKFIKGINISSSERTLTGAEKYYAIGSDFEPSFTNTNIKLGKRFIQKISDGFIDELMGVKNDLVVHRDSMFIVDPNFDSSKLKKLVFDEDQEIYHTVYFHQERVVRQCMEWLEISNNYILEDISPEPDIVEKTSSFRRPITLDKNNVKYQEVSNDFDLESTSYKADILKETPSFRRSISIDKNTLEYERENYDSEDFRGTLVSRVPTTNQPVNTAWCYANASMREEVILEKVATVEVILSREEIESVIGLSASGGGEVELDKKIIIQVQARKHCVVEGENRVEVDVPEIGEPISLYFDIIPKFEGIGEVRIIIRQGNQPIANLNLQPRFVTQLRDGIIGETNATVELTPSPQNEEIKNVLFIREAQIGNAYALDFEFEFEKSGQNMRARGRSEPFRSEQIRIDYIKSLYDDIENFWADSQSDYDTFMFTLRARGAEIFKELIPESLQKVFWEHRNEINAIQVFSDEPFIPWELVYLVEPNQPISPDSCFLAEKGLVRGYSDPNGITQDLPTKIKFRKDKARYVIPDYPIDNYKLNGAQKEKKILENILNAEAIKPKNIAVINSIMNANSFDILHFACHGEAQQDNIWNAGLLMEGSMDNGRYNKEVLTSSAIKGYANFKNAASRPLIFLNACQIGRSGYNLTGIGGFADAFIKGGAGAFVGTHWSVGDQSALKFSETFYRKLLDGENIMSSLISAREASKNNREVSWLAYVVYADPYAKLEIIN